MKFLHKKLMPLLVSFVVIAGSVFNTATFVYAENEQYRDMPNGVIDPPYDYPPQPIRITTYNTLPSTYNLGRANQTPVKDQGKTNICWAFSSMAAIESASLLKGRGLLDLSEVHAAYALSNSNANTAGFASRPKPDSAGNPEIVMAYLMRNTLRGAVKDSDDPLTDLTIPLPEIRSLTTTKEKPVSYTIPNAYIINGEAVTVANATAVRNAVKQAIVDHGAVAATIWMDTNGPYWNNSKKAYYNSATSSTNHVVAYVGWDDTYSRTNFTTNPNSDGAWLVKNSWGDSFGDQGYFWLSYADALATRYCYAFDPAEPADPDLKIYDYDPCGYNYWESLNMSTAGYGANVFTVTGTGAPEVLNSVKVFMPVAQDTVDIYFIPNYTSPADLNLTGETRIATYTAPNIGYYTIPIPGEKPSTTNKFAIVAKYSSGRIPFERPDASYNNTITTPGVSFRSQNGTAWQSADAQGNVCIKAVTTPYPVVSASALTPFGSLELGYAQPNAQTVTIKNTGAVAITLTQPQSTSTNYEIGTLSSTNLVGGDTATFAVQPKAGLPIGTYNDTITISSTTGAKAIVNAVFSVTPVTTYTISASALTPFGSLGLGYTQPSAQTVTITNTGTGAVMLAQPTSTNYVIGTLSTTNLIVGGTATFKVQPRAGLAIGSYNETIAINGTNGANATVSAACSVVPITHTISASALTPFDSLGFGYTQPAAKTVTITNTGTGAITLEQLPTSTDYLINSLSTMNLGVGGTATFTVQPKAGLAIGAHNETITIRGNNGANATVNAAFSVTTTTYTASASALTPFGSLELGYTPPTAKTVTITNTGTGAITLTQPASTNYLISPLSTTNLGVGGTATFTVQPKSGLAVGTYNETIYITGNHGANATVSAAFSVTAATTYAMSASTLTAFGSLELGYAQPAEQTVTITNTGTGAITLTQPVSTDYLIGSLSTTSLGVGGAATFTVQPKSGLAIGSHNETIIINGSNSTTATVNAVFGVTATTTTTYTMSASTLTPFGSLKVGYTQPTAQTVTITNTGTGAITLTQPIVSDYLISSLSTTNLGVGGTATFTVQPKAGLAIGTYNGTIVINGTNGATATVNVAFSVADVTQPTVTNVMVTPPTKTMSRGETSTFRAEVTGTNNPPQNVTWSVVGGAAGTAITSEGALTVAMDESATKLSVTAKSTFDTSKTGTAEITIAIPIPTQPMTKNLIVSTTSGGNASIAGGGISGSYVAGANVGITATPYSGYYFTKWTSSNGGSFANSNGEDTIFTMPDGDVILTATFQRRSSSESDYDYRYESEYYRYSTPTDYRSNSYYNTSIQTEGVRSVMGTSAIAYGYAGGSSSGYTITERGFVYSATNPTPTLSDTKVAAETAGTGDFSVNLTNLKKNTKYYVRAFTRTSQGITYGSAFNFTTFATGR